MKITSPNRVTHTYTQHLVAEPERVFPLLCPVREADWLERWEPRRVISESGVVEPECMFLTPGEPSEAIWIVSLHQPEAGLVEMYKVTPGVTVCKLRIELSAADGGCQAQVTYSHTSLGPAGDEFVAGFTEEVYAGFMQDWETRLNHYLAHGEMLRG